MSKIDPIHDRGQALEDEYFRRVDQKLLEELREKNERERLIDELTKATGLHDEELLGALLDAGIDASKVAALALTPLVFVAWADGTITSDERQAVISAALRQGVAGNPFAFKLLEQWLQTRPRRQLWTLWQAYAGELHRAIPPTTADKLAARLVAQAAEVAKASGGVLGIGKISAQEQRVIDEITATLPQHNAS